MSSPKRTILINIFSICPLYSDSPSNSLANTAKFFSVPKAILRQACIPTNSGGRFILSYTVCSMPRRRPPPPAFIEFDWVGARPLSCLYPLLSVFFLPINFAFCFNCCCCYHYCRRCGVLFSFFTYTASLARERWDRLTLHLKHFTRTRDI